MEGQSDKLDLYSIPVFLIELLILLGLAYAAHFIHFQHKPEPYLTGFYCDDIDFRHQYSESKLTEQFNKPDNELVLLAILLAAPILVVSPCVRLASGLRLLNASRPNLPSCVNS